uniref:Uncharacterized protein LOC104233575 n=1 Tax=Nicotiana sylvestris TaxID=4096 RepID=A0A1U7XFQ4_NICSY|nr:PREDICTED: uncharacterized protein LOC104233575 [Nicotiana sylvestris]
MQHLTGLVEGLAIQNQPLNLPQFLQPPPPPRHNIPVLPRRNPLRDIPIQSRRSGHIEQAEEVIADQEYSDEKKIKIVAIKLRGYASLWWETSKKERNLEGKTRICTWERMKGELRKQFLQETYEEYSYLKFHSFRQGAVSGDEYIREFEYLRLKSDIKEKPARLIARYLDGLNKTIANVIRLQPHWTFGDVVKLAKVVETEQKEAKATFSSTTIKEPNTFNHGSASLSSTKPQSSTTKLSVQKVEGKLMNSEAISKKRCHKCEGLGHIQADCPNKKTFTILEGATDEEDYHEEQHDKNLEEVAEYGNDEEYLMIQ